MARVKLSGAEIVVEELKNEGVEVAFGIPGGVLLDLYDVLYEEKEIRHILMRHEQCVSPDTKILLNETAITEIANLERDFQEHKVVSYDFVNHKISSSRISAFFRYCPEHAKKKVFKLVTKETGREIKATEDHPFWTEGEGWKALSRIKENEKVAVLPHPEIPFDLEKKGTVKILDEEDLEKNLNLCLRDKKAKCRIKEELKEKGLLPLFSKDEKAVILARLIGHLFGDGGLSNSCFDRKRNEYAVYTFFTGNKEDLEVIRKDVEKQGFKTMPAYAQERKSTVTVRGVENDIKGISVQFRSSSKALWVLLASLGTPIGDKAATVYSIPGWILNGSKRIKREFLAAYLGSECRKPALRTRRSFSLPYIHLHKVVWQESSGEKFAEQIKTMLQEFDINTRELKIERDHGTRKDGSEIVGFDIYLSSTTDLRNLCKFVGFEYSLERKRLANYILEYLEMILHVGGKFREKKKKAEELLSKGYNRGEVIRKLGISKGILDNWTYRNNSGKNLPLSVIPKFEEWLKDVTNGLKDGSVWETVEEITPIEEEEVMDLTVEGTHSFIANGFIVHNCAAHAADGYARVSEGTGVCIATSGPGATNLVTGLANASMDSSPVVALTGQVPTAAIGSNAFQEASTFTITMPITKHNFLVKRTEDLPKVIHNAFYIANTGRKGVVLIDLPKDVLAGVAEVDLHSKETFVGYKPNIKPNQVQTKKAAEVLANADRPLILAGGGVIIAGATEELRYLAEFLGAPVVTTLMGKGAIPEGHPFCLGMAGMHGHIYANRAINECDAMLAVGTRFSDRTTGWQLDQFAPDATLIHVDIDAAEINKNIQVDIPIVGDVKLALSDMIKWLEKKKRTEGNSKTVWVQKIREMHSACEDCIKDVRSPGSSISDRLIKEISGILDDDAIVTTEVGQCQMYAAHYYMTKKPRTFISSGGLGTMGFGFPAAIGAKVAAPDKKVVDIAGDGSFLMTCQDMATCVENDIPVVVCIFHNRYLGMVRQWQELFFDRKYSHTGLGIMPDFVKLAEAFGCYGERVEKPEELKNALNNAFESGKPAVIDMIVGKEDKVLPMIPPGGGLTGMIGTEKCKHV